MRPAIATPDSTFGIPIARTLGNCLSGASYARLVDVMGPKRVKDMLFTGRLFTADEALEAGLVNRIVLAEEIDEAVGVLAAQIAANAPLTLRATKEMLRRLAEARRLAAGRGPRSDRAVLHERRFPRRRRVVPRQAQARLDWRPRSTGQSRPRRLRCQPTPTETTSDGE